MIITLNVKNANFHVNNVLIYILVQNVICQMILIFMISLNAIVKMDFILII